MTENRENDIANDEKKYQPSNFEIDQVIPDNEVSAILFNSTIAWERASVKGQFILNGTAILATIYNIDKLPSEMYISLQFWIIGLLLAAVSGATAYLSQQAFFHQNKYYHLSNPKVTSEKKVLGRMFGFVSYFIGGISFICFAIGAWIASITLGGS